MNVWSEQLERQWVECLHDVHVIVVSHTRLVYSATRCNIRLRPYIHLGVLFEWDFFHSRHEKVLDRTFVVCTWASLFSSCCFEKFIQASTPLGKRHFTLPTESMNLNIFLKVFKCGKSRVKHLHRALFKFHFHLQCTRLKQKNSAWAPLWARFTAFMTTTKKIGFFSSFHQIELLRNDCSLSSLRSFLD